MDPEEFEIRDFEICPDYKTIRINGTEYECQKDIYNLIDYLFHDAVDQLYASNYEIDIAEEEEGSESIAECGSITDWPEK